MVILNRRPLPFALISNYIRMRGEFSRPAAAGADRQSRLKRRAASGGSAQLAARRGGTREL